MRSTYPEPGHHLHEPKSKYRAVLQPIQTRGDGRRPVGRRIRALALVDKEGQAGVYCESGSGNSGPDIPVYCQGLGDILGQLGEHLKVFGREVAIAERPDIRQGFVQSFVERERGEEDDIDDAFGEEQDGAVNERRL